MRHQSSTNLCSDLYPDVKYKGIQAEMIYFKCSSFVTDMCKWASRDIRFVLKQIKFLAYSP